MRRRALTHRIELLETRRLLSKWTLDAVLASGEHFPGCSCAACAGNAADPQAVLDAINEVAAAISARTAPEAPSTPIHFPTAPQMQSSPEGVFPAVGQQPTGALTGRIVWVGGGHGWTINNTGAGNWYTQRGELHEMIEDMGNQDQMLWYANYLWNAGATVVPLRPIGNQPIEVVLDNGSAGVTFSGTWTNGTSSPYYGQSGDAVRYRAATGSLTETATATYTPNLPQAGFYPVYTWVLDGGNRKTDQLYRINHSGGSTEVKVNHQWVGKGWVWLGTFHFDAGTGGSVVISNKSATAGGAVIADAIRFGNGMGTVTNASGQTSGAPREDEQSLYWYDVSKGVGVTDFYRGGITADGDANVGAPGRWAAYMNSAPFGQSVHLSFHSNAGGGRGTVGLYNNEALFPDTATPNQFQWAKMVGDEVANDLIAIGSPPLEFAWVPRTNPIARSDYAFGEIRSSANGDEFDSTILEVAFHDSAQDAAMLRDPKVRNWVGRSSYQATVKYFNQFGGLANSTLLPEPPTNVSATTAANGDVTIRWTAPVVDSIGGQAPTGYRVYSSTNGYGFDGGVEVAGAATTQYVIPAASIPPGSQAVYFKVTATNAGGESLGSAVVAVRRGNVPADKVLIVNGFDRVDKTQAFRQTLPNSLVIDRVRPRFANTQDYTVLAGEAVEAFAPRAVGFDSANAKAVELGQVNLNNYFGVIWLAGEQSTVGGVFSPTLQTMITNFVNAGGDIFVSGAEVGFNLVAQGGGASFFNNTLKAGYVADDASTYNTTGVAGSIFSGISLSFDSRATLYDADFPDVLSTFGGSTSAMSYSTGGVAAVSFANETTGARIVTMGFPFETITTVANRNAVMAGVLGFFGVDFIPPTIVGSYFEYQDEQHVTITFSEDVGASLALNDLAVVNLTTGNALPPNQVTFSYDPATNTAKVDFANVAGGYLADGNWRITFDSDSVTDPAGNRLAGNPNVDFFILAGDANRNRTVNIGDFGLLAANFNLSPRNFGQGDFNYDDTVTIADFALMAANFNRVLPVPSDTPARSPLQTAAKPQFSPNRIDAAHRLADEVLSSDITSSSDIAA